jgi:polar amino acid transport system substrate-binding protein
MEKIMMYWKLFFLSFSLSLLAPLCLGENYRSAYATEPQTIRMGYIEFSPVFYTDSNGTPQGLLVDLAREVVPAAGYNLELEPLPAKRMASSLIKGDIDLWSGLKTLDGFSENTYTGDSRLLQICLNVYTLGEKSTISTKEDLNQKMIIGLRGFSYGGWISYMKDPTNEVDFIEVNTHESALKVLKRNTKAGNKCYLLDYEQPVEKALRSYSIENLQSKPLNCLDAYFVVSKKTPNAKNVIKNLEATYKTLKASGQIK